MVKKLSITDVIEKNRINSDVAFLMMVDVEVIDPETKVIVETMRLVRNSEDVTHEGNLYTAFPFEISISQDAGNVPSISLNAKDITGIIQQKMQMYGGAIGFNVLFKVVSEASLNSPADVVEHFRVVSASVDNYDVSWTLGAENPLSLGFPKRPQLRDRCPWRYEGLECAYVGALDSCDLTLQGDNGCAVHANTINFGGFPGISSR